MTHEADDALRMARGHYRHRELTEGETALAAAGLAQAEQLARIADSLGEVLALARVALTPTPPEPACTVNVAHLEQGSPCPECGHTGYAHAPMNAGIACAICLGMGRTAPQDDETLPAPPATGKAWAATILTGVCHLPPFDDLSTDGPHGCSSCGHPAEQHRAGRACRGCLESVDGAAPQDDDSPAPDVEVTLGGVAQPRGWAAGYCCRAPFSRVTTAQCWHCGHESRRHRDDGELCLDCLTTLAHQGRTQQPDPAGQWLRDNAAQVIAALRAHADEFEDEASRGMYGSAEGEERAYALAQGQRARAITVRQLTSEPRL